MQIYGLMPVHGFFCFGIYQHSYVMYKIHIFSKLKDVEEMVHKRIMNILYKTSY